MDLIEALTLTGIGLTTVLVLVALGTLLLRGGKSEERRVDGRKEIMGSLNAINSHLAMLNGSVAEVTKRAHENSEKIAAIEGAHSR